MVEVWWMRPKGRGVYGEVDLDPPKAHAVRVVCGAVLG